MAGQFSPRKRARQQKLAEKGAERTKVKKFTGGKAGHDEMNRYYADYFLSRRGTDEYPESCIQIQYALNVFERLGVLIEEDSSE